MKVKSKFLQIGQCPLSRVLHVTLANLQTFGFEFHLRLSPSGSALHIVSLVGVRPVSLFNKSN